MADSEARIELKVKALPNDTYDVAVSPQSTVLDLKKLLEEKSNTPETRQRLIYRGRVLQDQTTLAENALENGHTIHLVERNPDAPAPHHPTPEPTPPQGTTAGTTRISVNVGTGAPRDLRDVGRIVQGVLSAVGAHSSEEAAANAPPMAHAEGHPVFFPAGAEGFNPAGEALQGGDFEVHVPHQLQALGTYLSTLETGRLQTRMMPLISLSPQTQGQGVSPQEWSDLTHALCELLYAAPLSPEMQQTLESVTVSLQTMGHEEAEFDMSAPFAVYADGSMHVYRRRPSAAETESVSVSEGEEEPMLSYPYLPLLLAAFTDVVRRTEVLLREKVSRSLANAVRQLDNTVEIDETNQELLIGGIRQVGSIATWYASLLVEVGRFASGMVSALGRDIHPIALNAASAISSHGENPSLPPFYPQGGGPYSHPLGAFPRHGGADPHMRMRQPPSGDVPNATGERSVPLSFSVEQSGTGEGGDFLNQAGSVIGEITRALIENRGTLLDGVGAAIGLNPQQQQQQQQDPSQGILQGNPALSLPLSPFHQEQLQRRLQRMRQHQKRNENSLPKLHHLGQKLHPQVAFLLQPGSGVGGLSPGPNTQRSTPAGLRAGLGTRPKTHGPASKRTTAERPGDTNLENTPTVTTGTQPPASQNTQSCNPQGMSALMQSVASMVGRGTTGTSGNRGGGLENMVGSIASNLANNPSVRRLADSPAVQQIISSATDPQSGQPNFGRLMSEMAPLMGSLMGNAPSRGDSIPVMDLSSLPPERAAVWRNVLEQDTQQMSSQQEMPYILSPAYLAGRATRGSSQSILPSDSAELD